MLTQTALVLVLLVGASLALPSVEYVASIRDVGFKLPITPSRAVTFPSSATVQFVQEHLSALGACQFISAATQRPLPDAESISIFDAMSTHLAEDHEALMLRCTPNSAPKGTRLANGVLSAAGHDLYPIVYANSDWRDSLTPEQVAASQPHVDALHRYLRGDVAAIPAREYPFDLRDYLHNTLDACLNWVTTFIAHHWGPLHAFPTYSGRGNDTGIFDLTQGAEVSMDDSAALAAAGAECMSTLGASASASALAACGAELSGHRGNGVVTMAVTADWGSGTEEAQLVADFMLNTTDPEYTVHIGDIYYVGSEKEVRSNILGERPGPNVRNGVRFHPGSRGMFAFQGNHEMYSRGYGYFDHQLPQCGMRDGMGKPLGQKGSYASMETPFWRVFGLDTGYNTYKVMGVHDPDNKQPQAVMDWITEIARITDPNDKRGIILMTHHQYRSAFEAQYLPTPQQLAPLLGDRRVIWLWGHEHHLAWYDLGDAEGLGLNCYGRCVGVGGFPIDIVKMPKDARSAGLVAQDTRTFRVEAGSLGEVPIGYNGWSSIRFEGNTATIDYYTLKAEDDRLSHKSISKVVTETFSVTPTGDVDLVDFTVLDKDITVYDHVEASDAAPAAALAAAGLSKEAAQTRKHLHSTPAAVAARQASKGSDVGNGVQVEALRASGIADPFVKVETTFSTKKIDLSDEMLLKAFAEFKRQNPDYVEPVMPI